jgi:hypothetical protein
MGPMTRGGSRQARRSLGPVLALLVVVVTSSCAHDPAKTITVTRLRRDDPPGRERLPICPSVPTNSLEERPRSTICLRQAKVKGIPIATSADRPCLEASLGWRVEGVGSYDECSQRWAIASCQSGLPYRHILLLSFTDPHGLVIESQIVMPSRKSSLDDASVSALCSAAFFRYPQELEHKWIESVDDR